MKVRFIQHTQIHVVWAVTFDRKQREREKQINNLKDTQSYGNFSKCQTLEWEVLTGSSKRFRHNRTEQNRTQTDKGWEQKWELLNKLYTKKWSEQHFVDDFG